MVVIETQTPVYELFRVGLFCIQLFNAMVRFILVTSIVIVDGRMESIIISRYLFKLGQYLSSSPPTETLIESMHDNLMNRGETNLTRFLFVLKSVLAIIKNTSGLSLV